VHPPDHECDRFQISTIECHANPALRDGANTTGGGVSLGDVDGFTCLANWKKKPLFPATTHKLFVATCVASWLWKNRLKVPDSAVFIQQWDEQAAMNHIPEKLAVPFAGLCPTAGAKAV
jgi:hypothetical protein